MCIRDRIKYFAPADYREGSPLECLVKNIIDRTATNEALERKYFQCFEEMSEEWKSKNKNEIHKNELIDVYKRQHDGVFLDKRVLLILLEKIKELFPEYYESAQSYLSGNNLILMKL